MNASGWFRERILKNANSPQMVTASREETLVCMYLLNKAVIALEGLLVELQNLPPGPFREEKLDYFLAELQGLWHTLKENGSDDHSD